MTDETTQPPAPAPDLWLESVRLAAAVYQGTGDPARSVLRAAGEFLAALASGSPVTGGGHSPLASIEVLLTQSIENQENIMAAIDNLQAADTALKAEVTQALTDFAAAITAANSANDPAIQAVADDMTAMVTQIQSADPASAQPVPPVTPPAAS